MQRVCIFIDGKSFHCGWKARAQTGPVDWPALARWLALRLGAEGSHLAARYYTGIETNERADSRAQAGLRSFLRHVERSPGYSVHTSGRVPRAFRCGGCGARTPTTVEKGIDVSIAVDLLSLALCDGFDRAVLVSGDGDFVPAVEAVRDLGTPCAVASWGGVGLSARLVAAASEHIDLAAGARTFASSLGVGRRRRVIGGSHSDV